MSTTMKTTALTALVLAAGLALAGCSGTPDPQETAAVTQTPGAQTPTSEPEPTETAPPVAEGYTTGQVLTAEPTDLEPSQRAFALPDGTFVIVDRYEPLPEVVQAAVQASAEAATTGVAADYDAVDAARTAVIRDVGGATAKNVVLVSQMLGGTGADGTVDPWTYNGAGTSWATKAEAVAAAQAYVAGREDANTFVLVIGHG